MLSCICVKTFLTILKQIGGYTRNVVHGGLTCIRDPMHCIFVQVLLETETTCTCGIWLQTKEIPIEQYGIAVELARQSCKSSSNQYHSIPD